MGMFDFLIDKNNGIPNSDMEYIYLMDMIWKPNDFNSFPIEKGTLMYNVIQMSNKSYQFTCKKTGEIYCTNYAWALAENTIDNIEKIKKFEEENIKLEQFKKQVDLLRNKIITLENNG